MAGIPTIEPYALPTAGELPANVVQWTAEPSRAVLLIHDMQRYFLEPLPTCLRDDLVRNAAELLDRCRALGVPVAYTAQPGGMTSQERGLLSDFWGPGMSTRPEDRHVVAELEPQPGDWQLTKWRYSAFFNNELLARLRLEGRDQLIICGVYAHVGILATAVEAFTHDIQPFLVADAIADFSRQDHRMTIEYASRLCAKVSVGKEVF